MGLAQRLLVGEHVEGAGEALHRQPQRLDEQAHREPDGIVVVNHANQWIIHFRPPASSTPPLPAAAQPHPARAGSVKQNVVPAGLLCSTHKRPP
jgi:hypothetical protein